jgi:hypothetical protein
MPQVICRALAEQIDLVWKQLLRHCDGNIIQGMLMRSVVSDTYVGHFMKAAACPWPRVTAAPKCRCRCRQKGMVLA